MIKKYERLNQKKKVFHFSTLMFDRLGMLIKSFSFCSIFFCFLIKFCLNMQTDKSPPSIVELWRDDKDSLLRIKTDDKLKINVAKHKKSHQRSSFKVHPFHLRMFIFSNYNLFKFFNKKSLLSVYQGESVRLRKEY